MSSPAALLIYYLTLPLTCTRSPTNSGSQGKSTTPISMEHSQLMASMHPRRSTLAASSHFPSMKESVIIERPLLTSPQRQWSEYSTVTLSAQPHEGLQQSNPAPWQRTIRSYGRNCNPTTSHSVGHDWLTRLHPPWAHPQRTYDFVLSASTPR